MTGRRWYERRAREVKNSCARTHLQRVDPQTERETRRLPQGRPAAIVTGAWAGYLTIGEAAAESRVSARTIRRALRDIRLPLRHYRIGRRVVIARADLRTWIEAHVGTPAPAAVTDLLGRLSPDARQL